MRRQQTRRLGWGTAIAAVALAGGVLWQLTIAQQSRLKRAAEPASRSVSRPRPEPPGYDLAASSPEHSRPADTLRFKQVASLQPDQQQHEEILIVGDPFRLALKHAWLETPLAVRVKPGRPVTFVALDAGQFANGGHTITVKADESGLATTPFYVDNEGGYRVLASSPESDGEAEFSVQCVTKEFRDSVRSGRHASRYVSGQRDAEKRRAEDATAVHERIRRKRSIKQ